LEKSENQQLVQSMLSEITTDRQLLESLKSKIILIKIGGNALVDEQVKNHIVEQIVILKSLGAIPVLVHGGGIDIEKLLKEVGVKSSFIGGHRKTDSKTISYIEMVLSGSLNKEFVKLFHAYHIEAVGISGKDAGMVKTVKRFHIDSTEHSHSKNDLGFVGDVSTVNTRLIKLLISNDFLPVISPISIGEDGETYNVNADMFAGTVAGALKADHFIALSNIDGLLENVDHPDSVYHLLKIQEVERLMGTVIRGGMIPKIESCMIAVKNGVNAVHIANGTNRCELLRILLTRDLLGTKIIPND
jgi:acetylglutamate kinase